MAVKSSDLAEAEIMSALCGAEMRKRGRHRCRMHRYIYIYIPTRKYNRTTGPARVDLDYGVWNAKDQYRPKRKKEGGWHMQEQVPRHIFPRGAYRNDGLF